ncbi:MAG: fumarylacetoacetate hydrolase family protein [Tistlia sp.]|uniref:fumarylacetoacetate hydrolase family protein n=1 Tax=Tistlia sp. TaxID=3057121 RepID=UPI0034A27091
MKLLRFGPAGRERAGLLDDQGRLRDLSGTVADIDGRALSPDGLARLRDLDPSSLPEVEGEPRLGPCVGAVGKLICVGLNYAKHAAESGVEPPREPVLFAKATSAIVGANDDIMLPENSTKMDWEVELGVVIGRRARHVPEAEALEHVAGYCVVNDVSERAAQLEGTGQWIKGKSFDTFGPLGPWLVTADEVPGPQALDVFCEVEGTRYQDSNTADMIFPVAHLVHYISRHLTLLPGDVIATGTPSGVGMGLKPQRFLKAGDKVRLGISGLGEQRQTVVPFKV